MELDPLDDVAILRYEIFKETQVKSERQKILNLKAKAGGKNSVGCLQFQTITHCNSRKEGR